MFEIAAFPKCYLEDISEGKMKLSQWIDMAGDLEVEGLEFYSRFLETFKSDYLEDIKKHLNKVGLKMPMMCYSPDFTIPDEEKRKEDIERQKEIIRVTAKLGGTFCRVLSGQRRPGVSVEDGIRWVVEAIKESLVTAKECNVILVMENHYKDGYWHYPEFAQKREVFLSIINQIDSPYFGVQYDPSNAFLAGDDPVEFLKIVKHRVKTMHASDRYLTQGVTLGEVKKADGTIGYPDKLCHGVTGKGLNDYDSIFSILRNIGFKGWISIEDGMNGMEEMKESANFLKEMREKYFGMEL